ncbi:FGGY family carbohydrate kinase [Alkalihalobacillus oceani]|uniref:xylulokinase n=1 Tax=Halalkalibacter oceani TaxID=1653776 RepID=UPI002040F87F|nr:FGGY family carbohydrate kinase [Halalkalibacter oceani]MCM3761978.1 FGGY family carbohydrate kinase [Halalkalibacter oceani]
MSHVIGVDIGTSGIKIGAMDGNTGLDHITKQPYSLYYPKKDWVEINPQDIWIKTEQLLMATIRKVSENGGTIDAISLSCFCNSSIFMNEKGEALLNGIMYLDQRSKEQADSIKEWFGEEDLYKVTRNRIEPGMYTVTTLLWVKETLPHLYEQTYKWGNLSTFILNKLTGQFVMDWTQASFSGLYDVIHYRWSAQLCQKAGIDQSILPQTISPYEQVGYFNGIPVIAGAADTACSSLALGIKPGDMFESVGTSNVLTVCTDNPDQLDIRFLNRCYIVPNQWLSHGAMSTPGATIQWFLKTFLEGDGEPLELLERLPNNSNVGANGLFFLPYMQGERSPIWDPAARGVFVGLHLNSTKADMLRSILEGTSFGLRQINEIIENKYQIRCERFKSIGGGSKNKAWAQIKANVLKKEIAIQEISETGVYGCCLIAGTAAGYFKDISEVEGCLKNRTSYIVKPETSTLIEYDELYGKFSELYPAMKKFFKLNN